MAPSKKPVKKAVKKTVKAVESEPVEEVVEESAEAPAEEVAEPIVEEPAAEPVAYPYPGSDIQEGMRSHVVSKIQTALGEIKTDGWYGRKTLEAVAEFQAKTGLHVNGVVDKITWEALFK